MKAISPFAIIGALIAINPSPCIAQSLRADAKSCTQQWLEKRQTLPANQQYSRKVADAFGKDCLDIKGAKLIDWSTVKKDLDEITVADDKQLSALQPPDIAAFCPKYLSANNERRRNFWLGFLMAVIKPEAGTNAYSIMWEQPLSKKGDPEGGEYSIGLLQLSISNRSPYNCSIPTEASLLDEKVNLACGVKILIYLVSREGIGGDSGHGRWGAARYWSTLRVISEKPKAAGGNETRKPIINALRQLPQCKD